MHNLKKNKSVKGGEIFGMIESCTDSIIQWNGTSVGDSATVIEYWSYPITIRVSKCYFNFQKD